MTLALALAGNTAIFTLVYRVVLNPLPYPRSNRLLSSQFAIPSRNITSVVSSSSRLYYAYADRARAVSGVAAYMGLTDTTLIDGGTPTAIHMSRVTASLSSVLGVAPASGRWFSDEDSMPGSAPVVVLAHGARLRLFGGDPGVIGRRLPAQRGRVAGPPVAQDDDAIRAPVARISLSRSEPAGSAPGEKGQEGSKGKKRATSIQIDSTCQRSARFSYCEIPRLG